MCGIAGTVIADGSGAPAPGPEKHEGNGRHAVFAWTFNGNGQYTPPGQVADYKTLSGETSPVSAGKPVAVGAKPIMLEAAN